MTYRIEALPLEPFTRFFAMTDDQLAEVGGRRVIADTPDSAPCRVSLIDAAPGEVLILVPHEHLPDAGSPYRQGGPVFVREVAQPAAPFVGAVPDQLSQRLLSIRAFDTASLMLDADVIEGVDLDARLRDWLSDPAVDQVHIHTARRGCYLARAVRQET